MTAEEITKDSEYRGTRILMDARMDNVRLKIQVDFGVGDVLDTLVHWNAYLEQSNARYAFSMSRVISPERSEVLSFDETAMRRSASTGWRR